MKEGRMKGEKKKEKREITGVGRGRKRRGRREEKKLSTLSVRRGTFQSRRCVPVEHSLQEKETIPGKW